MRGGEGRWRGEGASLTSLEAIMPAKTEFLEGGDKGATVAVAVGSALGACCLARTSGGWCECMWVRVVCGVVRGAVPRSCRGRSGSGACRRSGRRSSCWAHPRTPTRPPSGRSARWSPACWPETWDWPTGGSRTGPGSRAPPPTQPHTQGQTTLRSTRPGSSQRPLTRVQ